MRSEDGKTRMGHWINGKFVKEANEEEIEKARVLYRKHTIDPKAKPTLPPGTSPPIEKIHASWNWKSHQGFNIV
jgi:hypothetical protein